MLTDPKNNPTTFIDPLGLWSLSFDLYAGVVGGITIGQNDETGEWFGGGRLGLGIGGGANLDIMNNGPTDRPLRTSPYAEPCDDLKAGSSGTSAGAFVGSGLSAGSLNFGFGAQGGAHFDGTGTSYSEGPSFNPGLNAFGGSGISIGGAMGVEVLGW